MQVRIEPVSAGNHRVMSNEPKQDQSSNAEPVPTVHLAPGDSPGANWTGERPPLPVPNPQAAQVTPIAPLWVQPLDYPLPIRSGRPGILTAVAVISIILAAFSGLGSLWSGMVAFGFFMASQIRPPATVVTTATTPGGGATVQTQVVTANQSDESAATTFVVGPRGLEEPQRRIIIDRV